MAPLSAVFDERGGTLGRSSGNHLVLADDEKVISGEHAFIQYENGGYYYIDTSLNGSLFINRNERIHNTKTLLKDQDQLRIGDYDLVLSLTGEASDAPSNLSGSNPDPLTLSIFNQPQANNGEPQSEDHFGNDRTPINFTEEHPRENEDAISTVGKDYDASINDSFIPPNPENIWDRDSDLPDDLTLGDFFKTEMHMNESLGNVDSKRLQSSPEKSAPKHSDKSFSEQVDHQGMHAVSEPRDHEIDSKPSNHQRPEMTSTAKDKLDARRTKDVSDLLAIFFKAAGIEDLGDIPKDDTDLMNTVGTVFRELVEGLMTVIRGRAELKSHFRVSMTVLKPSENNPLKFTPTVEELLKALLLNNHPGFVSAVDAVREGYEDIMNHQLAINAGVQASLKSILKRFDPQCVSEKYTGKLVLQKKSKCWDEYRNAYGQIVSEALEDFFGDDFVRAYDEQISKLHTCRKPK